MSNYWDQKTNAYSVQTYPTRKVNKWCRFYVGVLSALCPHGDYCKYLTRAEEEIGMKGKSDDKK